MFSIDIDLSKILESWKLLWRFLSLVCLAIFGILICWAVDIKILPGQLVLPDITSMQRVIVLLVAFFFAVFGGIGIWVSRPQPVPTLKVFTGLGLDELKVFEEIVKKIVVPKFKEKIEVKVENLHSSKIVLDRLKKKKSSADLIVFDINGPRHELVHKGLIQDISETIDDCQGLLPDTAHPAFQEHLMFNDKRYFVPFRPNVQIVFWNKEKFAENELPKTWEEVREVAKSFVEKEGKARVAIQAQDDVIHITLFQLIHSAGGDPFNLLDPHSKEALEFLKTLYPYVSPESSKITWNTAGGFLLSGNVYLLRNWAFTVGFIKKKIDKFGSYSGWSWRKDSKPFNLLGGDLIALPKNTRHRELAIKLMRYLLYEDVQEKLVNELSWPPMRQDIEYPAWQKDHQDIMSEAIEYAEPLPENWLPHMPEIYKETFYKIVKLDQGEDIERILVESQAKIDAALGRKTVQQ